MPPEELPPRVRRRPPSVGNLLERIRDTFTRVEKTYLPSLWQTAWKKYLHSHGEDGLCHQNCLRVRKTSKYGKKV